MILEVLFVVFFVLGAVGAFWEAPAPYSRAPWVCLVVCIGILGFRVFGHG
jgi:hypothetical protein